MASTFAEILAQQVSSNLPATAPQHLVRLDQVTALLNSLFTGNWNNATANKAGQSTNDGGSFYIANLDNTNKQPSANPTQWRLAAAKGDSSYVYIAWASAADGTGFTTSFDSSKDYIAFKATTSPIVSPAQSDFTGLWKNYKGTTGADGTAGTNGSTGADGASAYVYIGYASDNTGTGFTTTFNANLNFVAIKTTASIIASPSAGDFTGLWKQYGQPALSVSSPLTYNSSTGALGINATNNNTANYIVQRDGSGNFAAGKITLSSSNATDHLTMGGQTLGFNSDAFYFSQPVSVPKIKVGTSHELRNTGSQVQLYSNTATANVWETLSGGILLVNSLRLTGLSGVLKADGSSNIVGSATTSDLTEGSNLYYTDARANTAADARITLQKGVASGLASLDSGGKLSSSQIPASLVGALDYQGTWNANTNSPALSSGSGTKGFFYKVSTAGATNLDGITDWAIGDWAVYNGTTWDKIDNTDSVLSVNGATGTVVLTTTSISEGSNLYYTDARARAAVLTGLATGTGGTIAATDTILAAFGKTENRMAALETRSTSGISEGTNLYYTDDRVKTVCSDGLEAVSISPTGVTGGTPEPCLDITGPAYLNLTAATEATDVVFGLQRIVQFATGALAKQRAVSIDAPKYAFVASSTITDASTLAISGAPISWSNATITNAAALRIYGGAVASANTNAYGLYVDAPTSATNNYAATFASGNVGIGTTAPTVLLDINGSYLRVRTAHTPASSSEAGAAGTFCWDSSYLYLWTATNTIQRVALTSF